MAVLASCIVALAAPVLARPGLVDAINAVRADGCGGKRGVSTPLRANRKLDAVARRISRGDKLRTALSSVGYRALHSSSMFMSNTIKDDEVAKALARRSCGELRDATIREIGIERRGDDVWIVLAQPFEAPALDDSADVSVRVLQLANEARSRSRRCGGKLYAAAPKLTLARQLSDAARGHAKDMAKHSELAHEGSDGSTPALRVTRTHYAWRAVGENVAAGPTTPDEVMSGWLDSPGHCQNLMDPRFTQMGIAYVVDSKSASGVYWAQVFAAPR